LSRLDIEWIAMQAGLKPANRLTVEPQRAAEVIERVQRQGFAVERGARLVEFPGRRAAMILYVSRDAERVREMAEVEAPLLPPESVDLEVERAVRGHLRLGELLGFPGCCVADFATRLRQRDARRIHISAWSWHALWAKLRAVAGADPSQPSRRIRDRQRWFAADEDYLSAQRAARASRSFLGRLNDLAVDRHMRIITFYPCRYDCPHAATYAAAVFDAAQRTDPKGAAELHAALLGSMAIAPDGSRGEAARKQSEFVEVEFREF
jgi:hypothetical protein